MRLSGVCSPSAEGLRLFLPPSCSEWVPVLSTHLWAKLSPGIVHPVLANHGSLHTAGTPESTWAQEKETGKHREKEGEMVPGSRTGVMGLPG